MNISWFKSTRYWRLVIVSLVLIGCGRVDSASVRPPSAEGAPTSTPVGALIKPSPPSTPLGQPTETPPATVPPPAPPTATVALADQADGLRQRCWFTRPPDPADDQRASAPRPPICAELKPGPVAPHGGSMSLFFTVLSAVDAPNAEVVFAVPRGVVLKSGQLHQPVKLTANVEQTFEIEVQLIGTGVQRIEAKVTVNDAGDTQFGELGVVYLDVAETQVKVLPEAPTDDPADPQTVTITTPEQ